MYKITEAIERAKEAALTKYITSPVITIYRIRNEKKLRSASIDVFEAQGALIIPLLILRYDGTNWNVIKRTDEAQKMLFDECLKEAGTLITKYFIPEIDNLVNQDIASILYKVLIEIDLVVEGHTAEDAPRATKNRWRGKASAFLRKYRQYLEPENAEEINMYIGI